MSITSPPLARSTMIDQNVRPIRTIFGVLCVGYSAISTIVGVVLDSYSAVSDLPAALFIAIGLGIGLAALIFLVQVFAEYVPFLYYLSLIPDTWYSYKPFGWFGDRVMRVDQVATPNEVYTALLIGVTLSFMISRFGEVLLFGKRRRGGWYSLCFEYSFVLLVVGGVLLWLR